MQRWLTITTLVVLSLGIATFSSRTVQTPEHRLKPIQAEDLSLERYFQMRASRASSGRSAVAYASTVTSPTTTAPATTTTTRRPSPHQSTAAQSKATESTPENPPGDIWEKLAWCESRMQQRALSANGLYYSYFQWTLSTYHSVGGVGDPRDVDYETQKALAIKLQARSGWGQWPRCSRRLGLR